MGNKKAKKKKSSKKKVWRDTSGVGPSQGQIDRLLAHYHAGRFAEAEKLAALLSQQFPTDPFAWKVLGAVFNQSGRLNESLVAMEKSVELSPNDAETHSNLGNTLNDLGRLEEAEARHRHAIAINPAYSKAHNNLGITLRKLGRVEEAEASYRQATALNPDFASAHTNLGNTLKESGRLPAAEASHRKAIALRPSYAEAHNNLGLTLQELGRLDEAEACYRHAIGLKPTHALAHSNLGDVLKARGRLEEAEACYRRAIQSKPDYGQALHMIAALKGENTARAPLDYVENLFDGYAAKFDASLVEQLDYQTPQMIAKLMRENDKKDNLGSMLDLGCGTGLFGMEISKASSRIVGIDISRSMLSKASEKGVYDRLVKRDIESYLSTEALDFDYFVATDVFVYLGELAGVFESISSRNKSSGKLVFSVEHKDGHDFTLLPSGRYAHSRSYIESLCNRFQYDLDYFETQNLRLEAGSYILGGLYFLSF